MNSFTKGKGIIVVAVMTVIAAGGISCAKAEQSSNAEIQTSTIEAPDSRTSSPVWDGYLNTPDAEDMAMQAISPPIAQGDSKIMVISAPEGFDSAAYVETGKSVGIYLIDNVSNTDKALERAAQIEGEIVDKLSLSRLETEANNAISASSFVPAGQADLTLVNVIVAPDMVAGNTVTLAFTYSQ